ncbi:metal ABC transporter permease [Nocardia stercoris]|uniref:Metal ABC transporter permease n=2 Tax=Nocardia stercoris TaxID=2483361 RepID=A0A3M2KST4_9NOCA|nr:metal ABC transporter permease [Nocardia stercoris]
MGALILGAIGLPIVGVIIIGLDIMPVRFAMMHVALLGIAVGMLTGLDPMVCALAACGASGAALTPLARSRTGLSGAMGLLMSLSIAGALLVLSISGVNANGAFELLWGSILATRTGDVMVLAALAVVVPLLFAMRRRQIGLLLYDRELAACSGVRVDRLTLILLMLVAIAVGAGIRLTGALLVDALTLLPALTARRLANSLISMAITAVAVGVVVNAAGFTLAVALDLPPGPVLVLLAGAVALVAHVIPDWRQRVWPSSDEAGSRASDSVSSH